MHYIKIPVDSAESMASEHFLMKGMHDRMAKAAFDQMKEHMAAANYHEQQYASLTKSVKDVTFMLTSTKESITGTGGGDTGEPASGSNSASEVGGPGASKKVKGSSDLGKADLVLALKSHEEEHGSFDIDVDTIASFLLAK